MSFEALTEHRDLVVAVHGHAFVEVTVGDEAGDFAPVRTGVTTRRVTIQATAPTRTTRTSAATSIDLCTKFEVSCCSAEIAQVIELQLAGARDRQVLGDEQSGAVAVRQTH